MYWRQRKRIKKGAVEKWKQDKQTKTEKACSGDTPLLPDYGCCRGEYIDLAVVVSCGNNQLNWCGNQHRYLIFC